MKHVSFLAKGVALAAAVSLFGCAEIGVNRLRNAVPQGSEFSKALAGEYLKFSESEYRIHGDDWHAWRFACKGNHAAKGMEIEPEDPTKYNLPVAAQGEIMQGRNRLMHALGSGAKVDYPVETAKAQVMFDCWVEQQEENFQAMDIAGCRDGFYKYLRTIERREDEKSPAFDPAVGGMTHKIFFKLGSARIGKDGFQVIQEVAHIFKKHKTQDKNARVFIYGHTDKVGKARANQHLSEARARSVKDALLKAGVDPQAIDNEGKGVIEGPLKEPQNRRVDIQIDVK